MDFNNMQIDWTDVGENNFEPLPAGWYQAAAESAELITTKDGTGKYLQVVFQLIGERFAGRKIWERFNIINKNLTTEQIAKRQLNSLAKAATGKQVVELSSSDEILGSPVLIKVAIDPAKDQYEAKNSIKDYKPSSTGGDAAIRDGFKNDDSIPF